MEDHLMQNKVIFNTNIEADNPNKAEYYRELGAVDISRLLENMTALPKELWQGSDSANKVNYNTVDDSPLQDTRHIVFKFSHKDKEPFRYFTLPIWEQWKRLLVPILRQAVQPYGYPKVFFPRVMLALLPAGCKIKPHTDGYEMGSRPHKIHIPIVTNEETFFFYGPEMRYNFKVGHAYEVNNQKMHGVENLGSTDRIHLIFECVELKSNYVAQRVTT